MLAKLPQHNIPALLNLTLQLLQILGVADQTANPRQSINHTRSIVIQV